MLATGFGALAAADCARLHLALGGGQATRAALAGWAAGWLLIGWAALRPGPDAVPPGLPTRASVWVPSVPFALALMAGAGAAVRGELGSFLIWNGAVVMTLIVARQILALLENISYWRELEAKVEARTHELERSEARFRSLVQNSSDVIMVVADDGSIAHESPSTRSVFGHLASSYGPGPPLRLLHPEDLPLVLAAARDLRERPGARTSVECRVRHRDGRWRHVEAIASNLLHDDAVRGFVINTRDITERKALEEQLTHRAFHDPLTNLANRALFANRLQHAIGRAQRTGQPIAVLFLDLDDFKDVNDSLGHACGDELLAAVARRLDDSVRPADTVARLGGDEFAILVEELDDVFDVGRVADRILAALEPPLEVRGREVFVRGSVGIATSGPAQATPEELLRNADVAMYTAKARGKGGYEMFESSMHAVLLERLELENDLRGALQRDEFELHYQPIVSLRTGEVQAVEALLRWHHPTRGLIPPHRFVRLAEQARLIVPIGRWVLRHACTQARAWQQRFPRHAALALTVNLSARQLREDGLIADVTEALEESGLDSRSLVLEITESLVVEDSDGMVERLQQLRRLGARVAVDDFGTGYSSLSYLRHLPVDLLKIDRAFMEGLSTGSSAAALAESIVSMARSLDLVSVAEGVELAEQASELRRMGCELAQGYHFARPGGVREISTLLAVAGPITPASAVHA
jgi:diguanylate cyclase (GGDEF)-like protein/PAS domain S-box-containing protein